MSEPHARRVVSLFNEANRLSKEGRWSDALAQVKEALAADPELDPAWLLKARCHVQLGQVAEAQRAFGRCVAINQNNYSAWLEWGHLRRLQGELSLSHDAYTRAIAVAPHRHEALLGMTRLLVQLGDEPGALAFANRALTEVKPEPGDAAGQARFCQVALVLGRYWLEQGRYAHAWTFLDLALRTAGQDPDRRAEILMDAAVCKMRQGEKPAAERLFSLASAATALPILSRLAQLSLQCSFSGEAIEVMQRAVALYPQDAQAWANLAHMQATSWQLDDAITSLGKAMSILPLPLSQELSIRASVAAKRGEIDEALACFRRLANEEPVPGAMASSTAMCALYSDRMSATDVAQLHRELFAPLAAGSRAPGSFSRLPLAGRRLRVGLVSADFYQQHPVNIFMQPVLRNIDRSRFEVFLYSTGQSQDDQTRLAKSRVEHWIESAALTEAQLAARIDADQIDVLMDLSGHTSQNRIGLFARRAAPVQVSYLGYPGSTGVPNIDYMLGDAIVTPSSDDVLCSERVLRLPGTVFCYAPEEDYPPPAFDERFVTRPLTFGSFNNLSKLTPRTLRLWARVLHAVPGSRLLLKAPSFSDAGAVAMFRNQLTALGVAPDRLEFRGPVGLPDMMAEYADVDIALDPVPYNGGTTTLQAMWMGVPVLTLYGKHFVSRMGASFMTEAGLPEWVAHDEDEYVTIAARMAADRTALLRLKAGLRQRLQKLPAWDVRQHTRNIESALQIAASLHVAGAVRVQA